MKSLKWPYVLLLLMGLFSLPGAQAKPWKGAELITREKYKYGAFEARVRSAKGSGMVTAFFLWKDGSELPGSQWQEQDFEMFGKNGLYQTQLMTPGNPRTENAVIHPLSAPSTDHYFTYRMEWTPTYLAFYVDGHLVRRETDRVTYAKMFEPLSEPTQLRMSLWAGDFAWSGAFDATSAPAHTYVEFLQVFNYTPGTGPNGSDFTLRWRDDFAGPSINTNRWWFANWTFEFAVNDYVSRNAAIRNGKLVLALTDDATSGQFPATAPDDNPPLPPVDAAGPQPQNYVPVLVPARIEAEHFSAYRDTTPGNQGNSNCINNLYYVDTEITQDISGVCHLSNTVAGEWTEYQIEVAEAADYYLFLRAASGRAGTKVRVELNGVAVSGLVDIPKNGWQVFSDIPVLINLTTGVHTIRVVYDTAYTNLNYLELELAGTVDPDLPVVLPARIEAEKFTDYYDTTPGNQANINCNTQDVDAELTGDTNGGLCNLGRIAAGEWVEYEVNAPVESAYNLVLRAATSQSGTMTFRVEVDGVKVGSSVAVPRKGWQVYSDVLVATPIVLPAGDHTIRIFFETGNINVNYLEFIATEMPEPIGPVSIPARIEAEDYRAAFDTTPGNSGPALCGTGDVDFEFTSDSGGVCNIANTAVGEWTEYEIITTGGKFDLSLRAATGRSSIRFSVLIDGLDVSGPLLIPNKGWQVYTSLVVPVELPAGTYTVRLVYDTGYTNINFIEFGAAAPSSSVGSSVASSLASSSLASSAVASSSSSLSSSASSASVASSIASSVAPSSVVSSIASSVAPYSVASSIGSSVAPSSVASSIASSVAPSSVASSIASSIASSSVASSAAVSNCAYVVVDNWGSGFVGAIRITNRGTTAINGWNVNWTYAGSTRLTTTWNAVVSGANPYSAASLGWNATIPPAQTVEFGFQGTHTGTAEIPVIRGAACN